MAQKRIIWAEKGAAVTVEKPFHAKKSGEVLRAYHGHSYSWTK